MRKMFLLSWLFLFFLLFLTACGNGDPEVETKEKVKETETVDKNGSKEEATKKESKKGTRSNPVGFNEAATFDDIIYNDDSSESFNTKLEVSIIEVARGQEAYDILKKENEYNEPAPEGFEWALVKAHVKVAESDTEDFPYWFSGMNFNFVSNDGKVYNEEVSAVVPDELADELYNGAEGEGYFSDVVKIGDDFKIQYETMDGTTIFFKSE